MSDYDFEKTSMAIQQSGGGQLNPLNMIHDDVKESFRLTGEVKTELNDEKVKNAGQEERIKAMEAQVATLQGRLWGLLAVFLGAIITGGVGLWFAG